MTEFALAHPWLTFILLLLAVDRLGVTAQNYAVAAYNRSVAAVEEAKAKRPAPVAPSERPSE